ncbi:MAG: hypothetical protein LBP30_00245 [Clostridiales Family XIII bacterium]|jgi:hypothetical protein|nr:hypothetical protein [Clostridiales Family XIII bacterium]
MKSSGKQNRTARMLIVLAASLALCVPSSGCAKPEANESAGASAGGSAVANETEADLSDSVQNAAVFAFRHKDAPIVPGEDMGALLAAIGEPNDVFEAPSCAFDGIDRIYYYPGFLVNTYPEQGEDKILSISFRDDSVQTEEGLYLGMNADEVTAVYENGAWNESGNALLFQNGDLELRVLFEDGVATDVTMYYAPARKRAEAAQ